MKPSKILEYLISFVEDPEEVDLLTREEVRIRLEEEGIDTEALSARLRERLAEIKAERAAEDAAMTPAACPKCGEDYSDTDENWRWMAGELAPEHLCAGQNG